MFDEPNLGLGSSLNKKHSVNNYFTNTTNQFYNHSGMNKLNSIQQTGSINELHMSPENESSINRLDNQSNILSSISIKRTSSVSKTQNAQELPTTQNV